MKVDVEKAESNRVDLKIQVDAEEVDKALDRAYRKLIKEVDVSGFRKGKAPRKVLENQLGTEPLYKEALDFILPETYSRAVEEAEINPIDNPDIDIEQFEEGKDLILKANVEVKPEVTLGDYKNLEIEKPEIEVKEEDVERELKSLQERHARLTTANDSTVEKGDIAIIDYKGYLDGQTFAGGIQDNFALEIGSGNFVPGFEDQLIGAKAGEDKNIKVTFPEDYREEDLAGKEVEFEVKVREIKRKEYLPLDDEFAKDVSEFTTLEELKDDIRNKLEQRVDKKAMEEMRQDAIKKVVDNAEVEVPESLIERRVNSHIDRLKQKLESQGYSLEKYYEESGTSEEDLKNKYWDQAIESVKTDLVLEEIAVKEKIEVKEEDVMEEIQNLAEHYNESIENLKQKLNSKETIQALSYGVLIDKTVKFLIENSNQASQDKGEASLQEEEISEEISSEENE